MGARGFTLIELVVVILIVGIVAAVVGLFIGSPVMGFLDQARRAALTDAADLALLRMGRDLRSALPNSVRTSADGKAIELLRTLDGDRYRVESPGTADDRLTPGVADTAFNTLAALGGSDAIPAGARLAIYPIGEPDGRPYVSADGVMTPSTTTLTRSVSTGVVAGESRLTLSAPHNFRKDSPSRRVFLVEGPVSYVCTGGRLLRYAGYALQSAQPDAATLASLGSGVVVASDVVLADCDLRYTTSATAQRNAVVRLALVLEREQERVRLLRQVHVDNSP